MNSDDKRPEEELFDKAVEARNVNDYETAKELCGRSLEVHDGTDWKFVAIAHRELGYIHAKLGDRAAAEDYYRYAISVAPRYELASLGLFQSLAEQGRLKEAFEEAIRLVSLRDSPEYRDILAKAYTDVEILDPRLRRLANRAREILRQRSADKDG